MDRTKKAAIVGTFSTWKQAPFNDPSLYIVSLNDAYSLGIPRADEWVEVHPLDKMWFRKKGQKVVDPRQIPEGHYVRPEGHLEWLQKQAQTIPVWLQNDPPNGWPVNAKRLPVEELDAKYGAYWASGPAYILMHLYERGFREFHIYGIHLATEHEYREQRPNFEHLLGRLLGPAVEVTVNKGRRIHKGSSGVTVILPESCPILAHGWKYAYEPKPVKADPDAAEWVAVRAEKQALTKALVNWPKGKDKTKALARLQRLDVIEMDIQQMRAKRQTGGPLVCELVA